MPERIFLRQTPADANGWYTMTFLEEGEEVTYKLNVFLLALQED
tara:strand:+ start:321 stop:452 length:132 start_codon:yes stop_codon:yes gene_type:complete